MIAGELRHYIAVQEATVTQDAAGGMVKAWGDMAKVWAAIEPLKGREYIEASKIASEVAVRIRIRYRDDIEPNMRVSHNSTTYEIVAVIDVLGRANEMHLMCKVVT